MKKMAKKLGAIVIAMAMCLSLCCTALAAETQTYSSSDDTQFTITINPAYGGETYSAYKIFDVTYSDGDTEDDVSYSYTIDSSSAWYAQVAAATEVFELTQIGDSSVYNVNVKDGVSNDEVIAVFATLPEGAEAVTSQTVGEIYNSDGSTGSTTITLDVTAGGAGYYYITTTLGTVVTIDTTNPNAEVGDKNKPPTVEKTVDTAKSENAENDKTVNYEFKIDNVHGIHHLVLEDKMDVSSDQVTYKFDESSLTVQLIDGETTTTLELGTDYVVQWKDADNEEDQPEDDCDFHVVFEVGENEYDFSECSDEAYVYITVDCLLNAEGATFEGDEFDIPNNTVVTYGNGGKTAYDRADVYEYAIHVFKYTGDIESEPTALADAHFTLTNTDGLIAYFEINNEGAYLLEGWVAEVSSVPEGFVYDLVTDDDGYIMIDGLAADTYYLTETQAPDGYNMLTEPIEVVIEASDEDPSVFTVNGSENHEVDVENNAGTELPTTGGIGTTIFYIIGGVLVAGAVVVLITRRRMSSEG